MKAKTICIVALSVILASSSLFADSNGLVRIWPFPLAESEDVLADWLAHTGFKLSRLSLGHGSVELRGARKNECWQITLKPHSPLATEVLALYTQDGQSDKDKVEALWAHLEGYPEDLDGTGKRPDQVVPGVVLSQEEHVVCIEALAERERLQFSGFIFDRAGLIISTAHDLERVKDITVILHSGRRLHGYIVAFDLHRDVALIKIDMTFNSFISLAEGRSLVSVGEKVYFAGCSDSHDGVIHSGVVSERPRRANGLPLLEVSMEVFPGNSGSPVFDDQGHLIGIIKGRHRGTNSVGFLIPLDTIIEFLQGIQ